MDAISENQESICPSFGQRAASLLGLTATLGVWGENTELVGSPPPHLLIFLD